MSGLNKYQRYIVETAFKNAVKNKPNTSDLISWYEENGDLKKRVDFSSIWLDADYIPEQAPELGNGEELVLTINNSKVSILRYYENVPLYSLSGTPNSFQNSTIIDSIESSFGNGYAVKLFDAFGEEIPFGLNKWVVDNGSGIVTFLDGVPNGYTAPFFISFYRYVGRRGTDGIITSDGKTTMLPGYIPTEDKSLVTKDYVDSNVTDVSGIVKKLVPNTPGTFEGKDLEIVNKHRLGNLITSTDPAVNVVYLEDTIIKLRVPQFWDEEGKGFFSVFVNGNEVHREKIEKLLDGTYNHDVIEVESIVESYPDDIVADGFYKSINLVVKLDYVNRISPYIPNPGYPIFNVKVKWYSLADTVGHYSNTVTIGLDRESNIGEIKNTTIVNPKISQKYISGVPAMVAGDSFDVFTDIRTLKRFKKEVHGHTGIDGLLDEDLNTALTYPDFGAPMETYQHIEVPNGMYSETMHVKVESKNLDDVVNGEAEYTWNIRTDSVSDESNRVTSPNDEKTGYGKDWDVSHQMASLKTSNELQMLNGLYQWPRGNYMVNGTDLPFLDAWGAGPNYDILPKTGTRYVTFKYKLENANGFYFELNNSEGFEYNPNDLTFKNVDALYCIVDGKYDWLNMNIPFDGVLSPFDFENKGCLVVNRSSPSKRYCTFGTEVLSGNMYIVLGIKYNLNQKLSGISVSTEK